MKTLGIIGATVLLFALSACEKCRDCSCAGNIEFEFSDSISSANVDALEAGYSTSFVKDYPDNNSEVCGKGKDFDVNIDAYEAESYEFTEDNTIEGYPWTVTGDYDCVCEDK
ncbi:MAG: hypothetical protein HOA37_11585 [Flavobacteriales bacterium]|nr:hypothetical protein [Flavobacteriales bacterium]